MSVVSLHFKHKYKEELQMKIVLHFNFNGNLVLGALIIFVHIYGVKETLKWLFHPKKGKKKS
jgi:hypothetical protein